jgi:chaperonin GroES
MSKPFSDEGHHCNIKIKTINSRFDSSARPSYNDDLVKRFISFKNVLRMAETIIKPLGDRVVVRRLKDDEAGTTSASGIIIPDTVAKEKPEQGVVVSVGAGRWDEDGEKRIPMDVKVGDRIVFSKYGYDEVKVAGEEFFIVSQGSILAILN